MFLGVMAKASLYLLRSWFFLCVCVCVTEGIKDTSASRLNTNAILIAHLSPHRKLQWQQPPTYLQVQGGGSVFSFVGPKEIQLEDIVAVMLEKGR